MAVATRVVRPGGVGFGDGEGLGQCRCSEGGGVSRGLSYSDAVRLLGGQDTTTVDVLDRLTGGLLLAASAAGSVFALNLFDPAAKLARLSRELAFGVGERLSGLGRFSRSERLAAAHEVIVVTAYFDAVRAAGLPEGSGSLRS
jgi:hypothetical protein